MSRALAAVRLALLFALACFLTLEAGLLRRANQEAATGAESPAPAQGEPLPGITVMIERTPRDRIRADMARLAGYGFRWARQRLAWDVLEPEPGLIRWQQADDLVLGIVDGGMEPVLLLDGSPAWARAAVDRSGEEGRFAPPEDPATLARFAAALAARYGDAVRYYQIWDEPNIAPHWGQRHIDPVSYSHLLRTVASAIRAADPDAVILAAALAPTADLGHTAMDEVSYLYRMVAAGALDVVDGIAVQPFGFGTHPDDARQRAGTLNFRRVLWVRRALVQAGYGHLPIWAMRIGWSTRLASPWGTVSSENQAAFAGRAFATARAWPWLAGIGWAVDRPAQPAADPLWGFALTPQVANAIAQAIAGPVPETNAPRRPAPWMWPLLAAGFVVTGWRTYAAGRRFPWRRWMAATAALPPVALAGAWTVLAGVYFLATWPPLIGLCWGAALWLTLAQPRAALYIAAAVLPFYFQHKELRLVTATLQVPPAHLLALSLGMALAARRSWGHVFAQRRGVAALMVSWLAVNAASALNVWHWPAYWHGWVDLALVPILLGWAAVALVHSPSTAKRLALALAAGGGMVALVGLAQWGLGGGTEADGVRRLVGPHYSPNHTALYLERTLFVGLGLAWAETRRVRVALGLCALMAAALLLTGSRGALLLAAPAGLALFAIALWTESGARARIRRGLWIAALALPALAAVGAWLYWERLANSATIRERLAIWEGAARLAAAYPWTGTGPGGFIWRFPAFSAARSTVDPNLRHAHSVWLEFATTWGAAGLLWLAALLAWMAHKGHALMRRTRDTLWRLHVGIAAAFLAALLHGQVDAFWALADLAAWNALALGLWAASNTIGAVHRNLRK